MLCNFARNYERGDFSTETWVRRVVSLVGGWGQEGVGSFIRGLNPAPVKVEQRWS